MKKKTGGGALDFHETDDMQISHAAQADEKARSKRTKCVCAAACLSSGGCYLDGLISGTCQKHLQAVPSFCFFGP